MAVCCLFALPLKKDYPAIVALMMQACDEVFVLQALKADLKAALEADPRFKKGAP